MKLLQISSVLALVAALSAHPMGNFSVNHYSRLHLRAGGADLTYTLDLAEIPTFQLLNEWKVDPKDPAAVRAAVRAHASDWVSNLTMESNGKTVALRVKSVDATTTEGAGAMQILRITIHAFGAATAGELNYEDKNFPGRAGWKEIVIDRGHGAKDLSNGLTKYPTDASVTPPQDLTAKVEWTPEAAPVTTATPVPVVEAPVKTEAPAANFAQQQPAAPGTVVRGDYLSQLLGRKDLGFGVMLIGLFAALGLGAMHALSPGHGKTIVAAYLVGSRGTMKHAGVLGFIVTFTHTFTVFALGLGVLFLQKYIVPEKIVPVLGAISGLSIVVVGVSLLRARVQAFLRGRRKRRLIDQEHEHAHMIEGKITPASLIALGVSGGLVPCPSALILMLSAIALGRPALGLLLLVAFSSGLAIVLMAVGFAALYAKHLLPGSTSVSERPAFKLIPVFSAVVVICIGLAMTAASAGWIQPLKFLS